MTRAILTHGVAAAQRWTPKLLTLALWYDASDASTITQSSGAISQWNDKSGNGRNLAQSTASRRPSVVSAAQNGRDVVRFTSDFMQVSWSPNGATSLSWFGAFKPNSGKKYQSVMRWNDNWYLLFPWTNIETITPARILLSWDGGTTSYNSTGFSSGDTIQGFVRTSGTSNVCWLNGTQQDTRSANSTAVPSGSTPLNVGGNQDATEFFDGDIYELLFTTSALSTADRQKTEGYLAHKWGLAGSLPSDHPYKNYPPGG